MWQGHYTNSSGDCKSVERRSERYLAAGMNDYIAKPIEEKKLFSILYKNFVPARPTEGSMN
jgi:CheY-like chemotaxis protein